MSATSAGDTEAAVYLDDFAEAQLRADGYKIGDVVADEHNFEERKAEIAATTAAEALAAEVAANGLTKTAKAQGAVNVPGKVVIQRSYTFSNYAGRFLYVEAHNKDHTDTAGPAMSFTYTGPNGTSQVYSLSNSSITPDGGDAAIGGNKIRDTDAGAGAQYMYHRGLVLLRGADATLQAEPDLRARRGRQRRVRHGHAGRNGRGKALPPRVAGFQKDFISKYMDPTEVYNRMDELTRDHGDIMQAINLPHKTAGYQRQANAVLEGTTVGPSATTGLFPNPSTGTSAANIASRSRAVQLFSKALGHEGGNNITAELKAPAAGTANAPLSITVTDGVWEEVDPADTDAADGFARIRCRSRTSRSTWRRDAAGVVTTTAKQVVDAINAHPAAQRARDRVHVREQCRRRRRGADPVAQLQLPARDEQHGADVHEHPGAAARRHPRRHGLLDRQRHGHPVDARPHRLPLRHARPVPAEGVPDRQGPLEQRGRRLPVLPAARA